DGMVSSGWVSSQVLRVDGPAAELPVGSGAERPALPLPAASLWEIAAGEEDCSGVILQSASAETSSVLTINGSEIRFTGTLLFQAVDEGTFLISMLDGRASIGTAEDAILFVGGTAVDGDG